MQESISEETLRFARAHRADDVQRLLLGTAPAGVDVAEAATQIEGWRTARHKLPSWAACEDIVYPPRLAMEQCSSEATARYKAGIISLARPISLADLTGGFGVDCAFMAEAFTEVTYVERNPTLCAIAAANFAALGLTQIRPVLSEAQKVLRNLPVHDWLFIDPARRDAAGRKMVSLADCEPDVVALEPLLREKGRNVMIKCSPMLDIRQAMRQLPSVCEVHVVSVQNECKELLFIIRNGEPSGVQALQEFRSTDPATGLEIIAVNLRADGTVISRFAFSPTEEQKCSPPYAARLGHWLYEPNASLLKAGCFKLPAVHFGLEKLHPNSQLYTSDKRCDDFPGRVFEITGVSGFSKQEVKRLLGDTHKANIAVRNFPERVETLCKRLHLTEGGDDFLFASTIADNRHVLIRCVSATS